MKKILVYNFLIILLIISSCGKHTAYKIPEITKESKPWTYWWWMGSAVSKAGISEELNAYQKAGFGGVHIIPIYGVKGDEENEISYLSDKWIEMLQFTLDKATDLGMAVDMTTGTGWPFGGPNLIESDKAQTTEYKSIKCKGNTTQYLNLKYPDKSFKVIALLAVKDEYTKIDLLERYKKSTWSFVWAAPQGDWTLNVLYQGPSNENVKRAAPGAEGPAIDYFSKNAINDYLVRFDTSLAKLKTKNNLRAIYNDSYELFKANWTDDFFNEFKKRRGYDFKNYFYVRYDTIDNDLHRRVLQDYNETISDLLIENFTQNWVKWSKDHHYMTRNQAHGSPGNILDMYALADIPETESFGSSRFNIPLLRIDSRYEVERFGKPNPLIMKFASSPSNLLGKKYTSSEATTWLANHFSVSLSQIKPQVDELFVSGINHIFFHGMTYSPAEYEWPGRLFYASTNYNRNSHFWNDLPELTGYISRCQSILQEYQSDNDVLVYFPIYDLWTSRGEHPAIFHMLSVHNANDWLFNTNFGKTAKFLWKAGFTFDYISDKQIDELKSNERKEIFINDNKYKTIIIPSTSYMPLNTLKKLKELSSKGVKDIFIDKLPESVSGWNDKKDRLQQFEQIKDDFDDNNINPIKISQIEKDLNNKGINNEKFSELGLSFIRKSNSNETIYFISNLNNEFKEGWVQLSDLYRSIEIYDPLHQKHGLAASKVLNEKTTLFLQLQPGESCFLFANKNRIKSVKWKYIEISNLPIIINSKWNIQFLEGKPDIPSPIETNKLISWTKLGDEYTRYFSGTALYSTQFNVAEDMLKSSFILDLGDVREVAEIVLNGKSLGKSWCIPFRIIIPQGIIKFQNELKIKVTNLSANRIKYMDEKGMQWKNFKDINFVDITYKPFDASNWKPVESGLLGNVQLTPINLERK